MANLRLPNDLLQYLNDYSIEEVLKYIRTPFVKRPNFVHAIKNHQFEIDFRLTILYPLFISELKFQVALDKIDYKKNNKNTKDQDRDYLSFGEKCYSFRKLSFDQQQLIIKNLGFEQFDDKFLNWINAFAQLRNRCAHNSKICNIHYKDTKHNIDVLKEHTELYHNNYYIFIHILYVSLFLSQREFKIFVKRLQSLFKIYNKIKPKYIPFRNNWKDMLEEFYHNNHTNKELYSDIKKLQQN